MTELVLKIYLMALDTDNLAGLAFILYRMAVEEDFKDPYAAA